MNIKPIQSLKIPAKDAGIYFMCSPKANDSKRTTFLVEKFLIPTHHTEPTRGSCLGCMFHLCSDKEICFRNEYEGLPSCDDGIFKEFPIYNKFEELYFEINQELFHPLVFTKLEELHNQLMENARSLYISTYNPLITKRLLTILEKPTYFGYDLILSVMNDELIIEYKWNKQ